MPIHHAKISGIPNGDPSLVGGEDWDDAHFVTGPSLVDMGVLMLGAAGAIVGSTLSGFTFSKDGTGFYRALANGYSTAGPFIVGTLSMHGLAPKFLYIETAVYGADTYITLTTVDAAGAAVNISGGYISLMIGDMLA